MLKRILEGRWIGHPLHPLIVHLPLGLWLMGLIFDAVSLMGQNREPWLVKASFLCVGAGSLVALLAIVTGFNDWLDIREDHPAQSPALLHMGLNMAGTAAFVAGTAVRWGHINHLTPPMLAVALSAGGYVLVLVGGYVGGLLVYDDGIGVGRHRRRGETPQETLTEAVPDTTDVALPKSADLAADFIPVAPMAEISDCHTLRVELRGYVICVANCEGKVAAFQEFCTHRCGPLSEGKLEASGSGTIQCPWHKSIFNLETGDAIQGPAKESIRIFETRVRDGIIHVRVPRDREPPPHSSPADAPAADAPERRNPAESPSYTRNGATDTSLRANEKNAER